MNKSASSDFRTVRGYQLANSQEKLLTPALEDYLEMSYRLCMKYNYTRVGKISRLLNVKPSSASKMIFKLTRDGCLKYDRYGIILMTEKGKDIGAYLLKRHDTVESFLTLIGNSNPLEETELIEHSLSPSTISDLNDLLEYFNNNAAAKKAFFDFKKSREEKM